MSGPLAPLFIYIYICIWITMGFMGERRLDGGMYVETWRSRLKWVGNS